MGEAEQLVGRVLHDTYRIDELLGQGGMGAVYRAAHLRLDRSFAVKVLLSSISERPEAMARFEREARITSGLGNPHIVDVVDFHRMEDGRPYIVMELLVGEDLAARMARVPAPALNEIAAIVAQAAHGLEAAHGRGVIHRDLKPQNIFLCHRGGQQSFVKVLDFGISKVITSTSVLTTTSSLMGTPHYMAPEQAEQRLAEVGVQTDVYAMGTILYQMLAGQPPFVADSIPALLYLIVHKDPPSLLDLRPDLGDAVEAVVNRALAKRPADRYPSVNDLAQDFARALEVTKQLPDRLPPDLPRPAAVVAVSPRPLTTLSSSVGEILPPARRTARWVVPAAGAAALAVVVLGLVLLLLPGERHDTGLAAPARTDLAAAPLHAAAPRPAPVPAPPPAPVPATATGPDLRPTAPVTAPGEPLVRPRDLGAAPAPVRRPRRQTPAWLSVYVISNGLPNWADVHVDGVHIGQSPLKLHRLAPGEHVVQIRRQGYRSATSRVKLEAGQKHKVVLELQR